MTSTAARARSKKAFTKEKAAKERRQMIMVAALGVVLLALLAFQLPKLLKSSGSSSTEAPPAVPTTAVPTPTATRSSAALRAALKLPPRDVFQRPSMTVDATLGSVAPPPGLHDPFASPNSVGAVEAPAAPPAPVQTTSLPGTIVLGTPGPGKVAVQGWIVILASIPTSDGQGSAQAFASKARQAGLSNVSVLDSSSRQGLRGGYWAVYTGPYSSLSQVSTAATSVHAAGFGSAYIRQLLVYKARQGGTATTTPKKKKR